MSTPALRFHQVTVQYAPESPPVVSNASFAIAPGERVALVGLNGSGKTTMLAAAVGLVAHQGEISVEGARLTPQSLAGIRERIGFLFNAPEDQLLFPIVMEDVAFGLLRRGMARSEALVSARKSLDALGMAHLADCTLDHLSHGQKQRVALAGALVTKPHLLLLDEPSASLDPPGKRALAMLLGRLDAAMIIATHDLEFAASICARFLILAEKRIAYDGNDLSEVERYWDVNEDT